MDRSEFDRKANEYLRLAEATHEADRRTRLLRLSDTWRRAADHVERFGTLPADEDLLTENPLVVSAGA
jgi:hypothetical protein